MNRQHAVQQGEGQWTRRWPDGLQRFDRHNEIRFGDLHLRRGRPDAVCEGDVTDRVMQRRVVGIARNMLRQAHWLHDIGTDYARQVFSRVMAPIPRSLG